MIEEIKTRSLATTNASETAKKILNKWLLVTVNTIECVEFVIPVFKGLILWRRLIVMAVSTQSLPVTRKQAFLKNPMVRIPT